MAIQELSRQEITNLLSGAKAVNAIVARIAEDYPEELPTDIIRQWEISALYHVEAIKDAMALGFKRRLEAGATVEPGPYFLSPTDETIEDLEDSGQTKGGGGEFNCVGFDGVGWNDPAKVQPEG